MAHGMPAEGTRRLSHVLGIVAVGGCALAYALLLAVYGAPYWKGWWVVMALLLVASFAAARALVTVVEWVIAGYKG